LRASRIRFSPDGAVLWYFCPIVNLWKPCQAMNDIWRGSAREGSASRFGRDWLVPCWWFSILFAPGVSWLSLTLLFSAQPGTLDPASVRNHMAMPALAITAVHAITVVLVVTVSGRQVRRHAELQKQTSQDMAPPAIDPPEGDVGSKTRPPYAPGAAVAMVCALLAGLSLLLMLSIRVLPSSIREQSAVGVVVVGVVMLTFLFAPFIASAKAGKALACIDLYPGRYAGYRLARASRDAGVLMVLIIGIFCSFAPIINAFFDSTK